MTYAVFFILVIYDPPAYILCPSMYPKCLVVVLQMVWFRENWYEEVLRQLRAGLAKCHVVGFHHRAAVADATVTPHTLNFIKKVVSTFGIGIGISESPFIIFTLRFRLG